MDRHDVPMDIYPEHVAQMHQEDLKIQHLYGCKGITYWCDEERRTAFCLIEAPDEEALRQMHKDAHGDVPHQIIEVDDKLVELFLGRIEDPENDSEEGLNVIREPAFRIVTCISISHNPVLKGQLDIVREMVSIAEQCTANTEGTVVKKNTEEIIISHVSAENALKNAVRVSGLLQGMDLPDHEQVKFSLSVNAGSPVTGAASLFGETLLLSRRMAYIQSDKIVTTKEVIQLAESTLIGRYPAIDKLHVLSASQTGFLTNFMDLLDDQLQNPGLRMDDLARKLGLSKSQLYRNLRSISGLSTNHFIKTYKLARAANMLRQDSHTIAEVAFDVGFNSPSYFSKSFQEEYGMLPSDYSRISALSS